MTVEWPTLKFTELKDLAKRFADTTQERSNAEFQYFGSHHYYMLPPDITSDDYDTNDIAPEQRSFKLPDLFAPNTVLTTISLGHNNALSDKSLIVLFEYATELQHLTMNDVTNALNDQCFATLAETYNRRLDRLGFRRPSIAECENGQWSGYDTVPKGLRTLKLKSCPKVTGRGLLHILQTCLGLETLKIHHCRGVVLSDFVGKPWVTYGLVDLTVGNVDVMHSTKRMLQDFWEFPDLTIPVQCRFENVAVPGYDFVSTEEILEFLEDIDEDEMMDKVDSFLDHDPALQEIVNERPNAQEFMMRLFALPRMKTVRRRLTGQFFSHLGKMQRLKRLDMRYPRFGVSLDDGLDNVVPGLTKTLESWYLDARYGEKYFGCEEIDWLAVNFGFGKPKPRYPGEFQAVTDSDDDDNDNSKSGRLMSTGYEQRRRHKVWVTVPYGYNSEEEGGEYEYYVANGRNKSKIKVLVLGLFYLSCKDEVLDAAVWLRKQGMDGVLLRSFNFPPSFHEDIEDSERVNHNEYFAVGARGGGRKVKRSNHRTRKSPIPDSAIDRRSSISDSMTSTWGGYSSTTDGSPMRQRRVISSSQVRKRRATRRHRCVTIPHDTKRWTVAQFHDTCHDYMDISFSSEDDWSDSDDSYAYNTEEEIMRNIYLTFDDDEAKETDETTETSETSDTDDDGEEINSA
ncbi:hypothetical protein BGW42_002066 [Actinomortierella wolfii]|nr:hypothetical protein BGW42_002066 [Actinomortierella wolfii]